MRKWDKMSTVSVPFGQRDTYTRIALNVGYTAVLLTGTCITCKSNRNIWMRQSEGGQLLPCMYGFY